MLVPWCVSVAFLLATVNVIHASDEDPSELPLISVCIAARNSKDILPYFLGHFEELDYDKQHLALFIRSDHNEDNTGTILSEWRDSVQQLYHSVHLEVTETPSEYEGTQGPFEWTGARYERIMQIKQSCLSHARTINAEYLLLLDTDALLTNTLSLRILLSWQQPIIAPLLTTVHASNYSNFWGGITNEGYYRRTEQYMPILKYQDQGCHHVAMVHTCVLIHLFDTRALSLSFLPSSSYTGHIDDLLVFGDATDTNNMEMFILNTAHFGYLMEPQEDWHGLLDMSETVRDTLQQLGKDGSTMPLLNSPYVQPRYPEGTALGMDEIYMINLRRRPERKARMEYLFRLFGMDVLLWPAVDGQSLNSSVLQTMGVNVLPGYKDPYWGRPLKMGEIGCFLSHYYIWEDMLKQQYSQILVLEDDVRFGKYFTYMLHMIMDELKVQGTDWDLIYLGRKWMGWKYGQEQWHVESGVQGVQYLSTVGYSYWTVGYVLSASGAAKLVAAEPLKHLMALDEYLPVMYGQQPNEEWSEVFKETTKLKAFAARPDILQPSHFTHEQGYVTDTEQSEEVKEGEMDGEGTGLRGEGRELGSKEGFKPHAQEGHSEL